MASIETAVVSNGDLLLQMTDGSIQNVGRVQGPPGADGLPGLQGLKGDTGRPGRDGATFTPTSDRLALVNTKMVIFTLMSKLQT